MGENVEHHCVGRNLVKKKKVSGPDLVQETEEKVKKIRERLKVTIDR